MLKYIGLLGLFAWQIAKNFGEISINITNPVAEVLAVSAMYALSIYIGFSLIEDFFRDFFQEELTSNKDKN